MYKNVDKHKKLCDTMTLTTIGRFSLVLSVSFRNVGNLEACAN